METVVAHDMLHFIKLYIRTCMSFIQSVRRVPYPDRHLVLVFFSPFSIAITSLGEEYAKGIYPQLVYTSLRQISVSISRQILAVDNSQLVQLLKML